jgi:hypothetical protein
MQTSLHRFAIFACALLCAATLAVSLRAQSKEAPQTAEKTAALPDTPVGRAFGNFLKSFNSGDLETMKRFHRDNGASEENAEKDMNAYQQTGGLTFHSVKRSADHELEALMQAKQGGRWLSFTVSVTETAPHTINRVAVQMAEAPQ